MSPPAQSGGNESGRAVAALRHHIGRSPLSQRKIEERAGFARGYLSQVLAGRIELKVCHLLAVLDTLSLPPGRFFAQLHPRPERNALEALRNRARRREIAPPARFDSIAGPDLDGLGVESTAHLRRRLERCERAIAQLEALGIVSTDRPLRRSERQRSARDE